MHYFKYYLINPSTYYGFIFSNILMGKLWQWTHFQQIWPLTYDVTIYTCARFYSQVPTHLVWTWLGRNSWHFFCSNTHRHPHTFIMLGEIQYLISPSMYGNEIMMLLAWSPHSINYTFEKEWMPCSLVQNSYQTSFSLSTLRTTDYLM